jgi:fatty acid-binding protein DegV
VRIKRKNEERIEAFRSRIKNALDVDEFIISRVGAVIGTHTSPGVVMCAWV